MFSFFLPETAMTTSTPSSRPPFYITTPIYYVNDAPHIGHAYTTIMADVLARYHRMLGAEVFFLTGTDEHGQKVERAAKARGKAPLEHCDELVVRFQDCWARLGISYDRFIRTTDAEHVLNVQAALQRVYDQGDIYVGEYMGHYHVADETFVTADKVTQADLDSGDVIELSEKNYFFRLSKYQDWLIEYIQKQPDFVLPEARRNWVLGHLREPLADLCISRPKERLSWGIELPFDTGYVCYVWFDALLNYLTGIGYNLSQIAPGAPPEGPGATDSPQRHAWFWRHATNLIGKDILQHHAIYWPIMLRALGVDNPRHVLGHGWWMGNEGEKISKRRGGSGAWMWLADDHGPDFFRYFLTREMVLGQDSTISEDLFATRVNSDLANDLGNLISRAGKIAARQFGGTMPPDSAPGADEERLLAQARAMQASVPAMVDTFAPQNICEAAIALVRETNRYFDAARPWELAKDPARRDDLARVLRTSLEMAAFTTATIAPVVPFKADAVFAALGSPLRLATMRYDLLEPGRILTTSGNIDLETGLFPRIERRPAEAAPAAEAPAPKPAKGQKPAPTSAEAAAPEGVALIDITDFFRASLITAIVKEAERVEGSDKLLKLQVDDGQGGRQIVAGIAKFYEPHALVGRRIIIVGNLKPAMLFGLESQGMLLAAKKGKKLSLITTDDPEFVAGASVG